MKIYSVLIINLFFYQCATLTPKENIEFLKKNQPDLHNLIIGKWKFFSLSIDRVLDERDLEFNEDGLIVVQNSEDSDRTESPFCKTWDYSEQGITVCGDSERKLQLTKEEELSIPNLYRVVVGYDNYYFLKNPTENSSKEFRTAIREYYKKQFPEYYKISDTFRAFIPTNISEMRKNSWISDEEKGNLNKKYKGKSFNISPVDSEVFYETTYKVEDIFKFYLPKEYTIRPDREEKFSICEESFKDIDDCLGKYSSWQQMDKMIKTSGRYYLVFHIKIDGDSPSYSDRKEKGLLVNNLASQGKLPNEIYDLKNISIYVLTTEAKAIQYLKKKPKQLNLKIKKLFISEDKKTLSQILLED
jgi:hypothetical protein